MTTPEKITKLEPNEIFVFGSNRAGRHGAGAAKQALEFGAEYGVGSGVCGSTYGIPTKGYMMEVLPLHEIRRSVERFLEVARSHPTLTFLVTPIGCGLAGYDPSAIGPMFKFHPPNVTLPACFLPYV